MGSPKWHDVLERENESEPVWRRVALLAMKRVEQLSCSRIESRTLDPTLVSCNCSALWSAVAKSCEKSGVGVPIRSVSQPSSPRQPQIKSARTTSKQGVDEPPQGGLDSGVEEIDYEELANTLLVHVMNILRQSETTDSSDWMRRIEELDGANLALQRELARTREDAESLKAERDLAVDQLDAATQELSALRLKRARVMSDQDRALLENVVHPQATHSNSSTQRAV